MTWLHHAEQSIIEPMRPVLNHVQFSTTSITARMPKSSECHEFVPCPISPHGRSKYEQMRAAGHGWFGKFKLNKFQFPHSTDIES